jgi:hypothetical protein
MESSQDDPGAVTFSTVISAEAADDARERVLAEDESRTQRGPLVIQVPYQQETRKEINSWLSVRTTALL